MNKNVYKMKKKKKKEDVIGTGLKGGNLPPTL